jgi:phi LC3 family holin
MKINWKARFKNKTFLITFVTLVVTFVYQVLGLFGVVPSVSEESVVNVITLLVNILAFVGVIVDPTTDGINDSDRAMLYFTELDERNVEQ